MTERQAGKVVIDVCQGGCGGIWFDAFELAQIEALTPVESEQLLAEVTPDVGLQLDHAAKRSCPRCEGIKLKRHFYSKRKTFQIDSCPNCSGYWLDAGELHSLRADREAAATESSKKKNISMEMIRYLYRMKTEGKAEA